MMKKRKKSILMLATMGVFFISGCGAKENVPEIPSEPFVNEVLSSLEEQTTIANETPSIVSDETLIETLVQSEEPAKTESVSESKLDNEQKPAAQTAPAKAQEPATAQTAPAKAQESVAVQTASAKEIKYVDVTHIFKPYEQAVDISLQMPEDWKYTIWDVEEESPDWGYSIETHGMADAGFDIFGQFGTLTADGYSNGPKSFQTSKGLVGQYSWDEYTLDDGNPAVQGMIVFDTELAGFYGVSFNMPKSVYSENKDIIDKVFQSIIIKEAQ